MFHRRADRRQFAWKFFQFSSHNQTQTRIVCKLYEIWEVTICMRSLSLFRWGLRLSKIPPSYELFNHVITINFVLDKPCALFCTPTTEERFSVKFSSKVIDGTPCMPGASDLCVDGKCHVSSLNFLTSIPVGQVWWSVHTECLNLT